jgi:hypothetical protein
MSVLDQLRVHVRLAQLAGGPSMPERAAAVTSAGGLASGAGPVDLSTYEPYLTGLHRWASERELPLGDPRSSDDHRDEKIELLLRARLPVVSFTFGCPGRRIVEALHDPASRSSPRSTRRGSQLLLFFWGARALVGDELWVAASLSAGEIIADPFRRGAEIALLVIERRRQLTVTEPRYTGSRLMRARNHPLTANAPGDVRSVYARKRAEPDRCSC